MARRNAIRAGVFDQRGRATTRRRDGAPRAREDEWPGILAELEDAIFDFLDPFDDEPDALERLDWRRFLSAVDGIDATPAEKLRQLAIAIEHVVSSMVGKRGWTILERLYGASLQLEPHDDLVLGSAGISALRCAEDQAPAIRERLLSVALDRARRATALAPDDPGHHHLLGRIAYVGDRPEEALAHFEAAVVCEPGYVWSQLFRAYTLHDLSRFTEAADAYEAVDLSQMTGDRAWRLEDMRDNLAECLYQSGRIEAAVEQWQAAIDRIARRRPGPDVDEHWFLIRAARGPQRERLFAPLLAAAGAVADQELLDALTAPD